MHSLDLSPPRPHGSDAYLHVLRLSSTTACALSVDSVAPLRLCASLLSLNLSPLVSNVARPPVDASSEGGTSARLSARSPFPCLESLAPTDSPPLALLSPPRPHHPHSFTPPAPPRSECAFPFRDPRQTLISLARAVPAIRRPKTRSTTKAADSSGQLMPPPKRVPCKKKRAQNTVKVCCRLNYPEATRADPGCA